MTIRFWLTEFQFLLGLVDGWRRPGMQICRIQHKESGLGPYQHSFGLMADEEACKERGLSDPYSSWRCPAPYTRDQFGTRWLREPEGKWHFAFKDLDQLMSWFPGDWLAILHDEGFELAILEVAFPALTVRTSEQQVMFQTKHARMTGRMDLI